MKRLIPFLLIAGLSFAVGRCWRVTTTLPDAQN
jgi:hypothetical protein